LTKNNHVKIGDLGLVETIDNLYLEDGIHSPYDISSAYLSPEMHCHLFNPEVIVTPKTDIWYV
jgi:hypothetical protein